MCPYLLLYWHGLLYNEGKRKRSDSILLKAPTPTDKSKNNVTNQKRHQKFDYTTIADRLRTVS